jgi:hypothetical protein
LPPRLASPAAAWPPQTPWLRERGWNVRTRAGAAGALPADGPGAGSSNNGSSAAGSSSGARAGGASAATQALTAPLRWLLGSNWPKALPLALMFTCATFVFSLLQVRTWCQQPAVVHLHVGAPDQTTPSPPAHASALQPGARCDPQRLIPPRMPRAWRPLQSLKDGIVVCNMGPEVLPVLSTFGSLPATLAFFSLYRTMVGPGLATRAG